MITLVFLAGMLAQDDAAAKTALEAFKTTYAKSKDAKSHAAAVTELAKTLHETVAVKLGSLLTTDDKEVRLAAAAGLATFDTPAELKLSASKLLAQALTAGANLKEIDVRVAIFAAIGTLQEESSANAVKNHFEDRDSRIASAAVAAAGGLRSKTLIDPLIQELRDCEKILKPDGNAPIKGKTPTKAPPPPAPSNSDKEKKDRATAVAAAAVSALGNITRQNFSTGDEWEKWWIKNRSGFTVPK